MGFFSLLNDRSRDYFSYYTTTKKKYLFIQSHKLLNGQYMCTYSEYLYIYVCTSYCIPTPLQCPKRAYFTREIYTTRNVYKISTDIYFIKNIVTFVNLKNIAQTECTDIKYNNIHAETIRIRTTTADRKLINDDQKTFNILSAVTARKRNFERCIQFLKGLGPYGRGKNCFSPTKNSYTKM